MISSHPLTPLCKADFSDPEKVYFVDVETTGLNPEVSEILQCAIVNGNGERLLNKFYDSWYLQWPEAEAVNHITKEAVEGLPVFEQEAFEVTKILADAKVIAGYNVRFDVGFLEAGGVSIPRCQIVDIMADFSHHVAEYIIKRQSLASACRRISYDNLNPHDALDDCTATLAVARFLQGEGQ